MILLDLPKVNVSIVTVIELKGISAVADAANTVLMA